MCGPRLAARPPLHAHAAAFRRCGILGLRVGMVNGPRCVVMAAVATASVVPFLLETAALLLTIGLSTASPPAKRRLVVAPAAVAPPAAGPKLVSSGLLKCWALVCTARENHWWRGCPAGASQNYPTTDARRRRALLVIRTCQTLSRLLTSTEALLRHVLRKKAPSRAL